MLSPEEIANGYFGSRRLSGLFPSPIKELAEYKGGETLHLACTQLDVPASAQKAIVKEWVKALPILPVKTVLFESKVTQELFDAVTQIPTLEAFYIKWSSIKSIESISSCNSLRALAIGSSPSLTGLKSLSNLQRLQILTIENVKEAQDLSFVTTISSLEEFGVSGSGWNEQKVDSLIPLQTLKNLELLWLISSVRLKIEQIQLVSIKGQFRE